MEGSYLRPDGLLILILPLALSAVTGIGVALFIGSRSNWQPSFEGPRLKRGGGGIRFAYLFGVWTILGIVLFGALSLLGCLALELYWGNPYAPLGLGLLVVAIPVVLAGIGLPLFLRYRGNLRPSPMRDQKWKEIEFDEVPDKNAEETAQSDAFSKRQKNHRA